ncbi:EamA/RhaT family transporter, partial [Gordonia sp. OPL2]|uniref:EamA/RhaT family transporter n=1 Tax=Gordonia sp. OPL2 TaxID=2486274 RepID=UPI0021CD0149
MFAIGVIAAALAAIAYGLSTVLRAVGARRALQRLDADSVAGSDVGPYGGSDAGSADGARSGADVPGGPGAGSARSTVAAFGDSTFLLGTLLVILGFAGGAVAARFLPLFLAQTIVAGNLVVTALLGMVWLGNVLGRREWVAVGVVVVSLFLLGASASHQAAPRMGMGFHWALFGVSLVLVVTGFVVMRTLRDRGAIFCGALAGVMYGAIAIAVRVLDGVSPFDPVRLLTDPAAWTIAIAGATAFYVQTVALQIGPVNAVTAVLVVGETGGPAIVGVMFLGDKAIDGLQWLAVVGFVGAIVGATAVALFTGDDDGAGRTDTTRVGAEEGAGGGS